MKTKYLPLILAACLIQQAAAENTVSIGYAQAKISDGDTLRGVNVKYNHEFANKWGIIGSVSYLEGDKNGLRDTTSIAPDILDNGSRKTRYVSLAAGPSYRVHPAVSVYGLLGVAQTKADASADWLNHESGRYVNRGSVSSSHKRTSVSYGAGVQIHPAQNLTVDIAYEGAGSSNGLNNKAANSFHLGIGYRF